MAMKFDPEDYDCIEQMHCNACGDTACPGGKDVFERVRRDIDRLRTFARAALDYVPISKRHATCSDIDCKVCRYRRAAADVRDVVALRPAATATAIPAPSEVKR